jgi:hypothetical protein
MKRLLLLLILLSGCDLSLSAKLGVNDLKIDSGKNLFNDVENIPTDTFVNIQCEPNNLALITEQSESRIVIKCVKLIPGPNAGKNL